MLWPRLLSRPWLPILVFVLVPQRSFAAAQDSKVEAYLDAQRPEIYREILEKRELTDDIKAKLKSALEEFGKRFVADSK